MDNSSLTRYADGSRPTAAATTRPSRTRLLGSSVLALVVVFLLAGALDSKSEAETVSKTEAEIMTLEGDLVQTRSNASGGEEVAFYTNSSAKTGFEGKPTNLTLRARGQSCQGNPQLKVYVDGALKGEVELKSSAFADYAVTLSGLSGGAHTLRISFENDYYRPNKCDRNAYLDYYVLSLAEENPPPPPPPPDPTCTGPLTITAGGTYSGCWVSTNSSTPAVTVATTQPVTITDSVVKGPYHLIKSSVSGTDLTVESVEGYGVNPNISGREKGRFLNIDNPKDLRVLNNYMERTAGMKVLGFVGDSSPSQTITILRNKAKNIDGRYSNGSGGYQNAYALRQFIQFDKVRNIGGAEIAWNEVINEPFNSAVEDNISMYLSSGRPGSPIDIHDNYIEGGYPADAARGSYSGGGIMLGDGSASTAGEVSHHVIGHHNQVVDTTNYGIAICGGHDISYYNNRVLSDGRLDDGTAVAAQNVGIYVWNLYNNAYFYSNFAYSNESGWAKASGTRNDWWFPDASGTPTNTHIIASPIDRALEQAEYVRWLAKLSTSGVSVGP